MSVSLKKLIFLKLGVLVSTIDLYVNVKEFVSNTDTNTGWEPKYK